MTDDRSTRPYCSQPALHGERLAFVTAGDLWSIKLGELVARRLTSVAGGVTQPKISPDGKLLAFAARHDGPTGLFVMPADGGEAQRLVHHPSPCEPAGFTPDSRRVLFVSSLASTNPRTAEMFSVSVEGGDVVREPFGPATAIAMHADGRLVIGRGYQDPAKWKRYAGGLAGQLWSGRREPLALERISRDRRGESQPSFWGDRIVFLSDMEGAGNIWSCLADGSDRHRHTLHDDAYVRWPSVHGGRVAYQHAGDIYLLDLATDRTERVDVEIGADVASVRRRYVDPSRFLERADISPDGSRVLLTVRGHAVAMPAWRGPTRVLGDEDGVRFSHATWLPDGKHVALVHDRSGEEELEVRALDVREEPRSLGPTGAGRLRCMKPSPDGKWLLLSEQAAGLQLLDLESGKRVDIDRPDSGAITEFDWSPDSRWLAYARPKRYRSVLVLYGIESRTRQEITTPEFDDGLPCFDPSGRYLYFLSRRIFNPYADELQHDVGFPAATKPYAVVLSADRPSPFAPLPPEDLGLEDQRDKPEERDKPAADKSESPEEREEPADESLEGSAAAVPPPEGDGKDAVKPKVVTPIRLDLEDISLRIVEIPVREGRYAGILATRERVFFMRRPLLGMFGSGTEDDGDEHKLCKLVAFELASREEKVWATDVKEARLSFDGKQLLLRGNTELRIVSASKPPQTPSVSAGKPGEKTGVIDLARVRVRVDPRSEWRQIFRDAWRQQRGHFWTEALSPAEWNDLFARHEPLVRRVRTRDELSDILWEMHGELGTSHAYVVGGDEPWRPHYRTGLLGADFRLDAASNLYRIEAIHVGDTWSPGAHSPLAAPGVKVRIGDFLLAVDGRPAGGQIHPWMLLERPGPAVTLTIATKADGSDARDVVVAPLSSEYRCRYREWVKRNQAIVDQRTEGRIGYIHVPDMLVAGLVEFHRAFLWQSSREGLIVDVRDNGGGNVSQILLEKLSRRWMGYVKARWAQPEPLPDNTVLGPMVALCNERTGSDGDIFCQSWKQLGLGPLIGTRTWGGVIGIDRSRTLVDGGLTTQPEYAYWFRDRGWDVEGSGVDPDIVVDLTPVDVALGKDPQMDRAIEEVLRLRREQGVSGADLPPPPDRAWRPGKRPT